jgi:ferredoxin-NADP reductase
MLSTRFFGEKSSTFKKALMDLPKGGKMKAFGPSPLKDRYRIKDMTRPHILVMGGIGVTPARSVLTDLDQKGYGIKGRMLYANETDQFAFREELDRITSSMPDFNIEYIVAPRRIELEDFKKTKSDFNNAVNYISGPPGFVKAMEKYMKELGIRGGDVKYDSFVLSFLGVVLQKGYR